MNASPILLVEDDDNDVFFFRRAMARAAFSHPLCVARDGREATHYFCGTGPFAERAQFPLPCLVVLDLNLPEQHGLDLLQWIRAQAPNPVVPVVILTSSTSERDLREAYRRGANSYLIKPSKQDELVDLVGQLRDYLAGTGRLPPPPLSEAG